MGNILLQTGHFIGGGEADGGGGGVTTCGVGYVQICV